jgi:hypothetical protein
VFQLNPSSGGSDLSKELGYRVSITGQLSSARASSKAAATAGTSGSDVPRATDRAGNGDQLPTLTVTSVERTTGMCPAGW